MLRLVLLLLYLAASFSSGDLHGNLDPNGLPAQPAGDLHGNLDPDG
ncbi:MAG: hypothetical protein ACJ76J_09355 [Thermoanaerobaculia bacterium]